MFLSILELSRMSSIKDSKSSTFTRIISAYLKYSGFEEKYRFITSAHYLIAFKGVLYSWETVAKRLLLNAN